jgi:hypothetical protein
MKAQRGTVFLKLLHLSDFTEFRPSSETVSQALLAPLSDFAHSVEPSAHREGHGEREREIPFVKLFLHLSDFAHRVPPSKQKERPFFVKLFLHLSHFAESSTIKAQRERERERETHATFAKLFPVSQILRRV